MPKIRVAALDQLKPGEMIPAQYQGLEMVVCNDGRQVHAFHGLCPHRNGPLAQGNFVEGRIICPWHAWEFRCADGQFDYNPDISLTRYPVAIESGDIFVELPANGEPPAELP